MVFVKIQLMFYQKADTIDMINIYMHNIPLESKFHSQYYAYIRLGYEKLNDTSQVPHYPYTALSTY